MKNVMPAFHVRNDETLLPHCIDEKPAEINFKWISLAHITIF
jgi:hypothetical protein